MARKTQKFSVVKSMSARASLRQEGAEALRENGAAFTIQVEAIGEEVRAFEIGEGIGRQNADARRLRSRQNEASVVRPAFRGIDHRTPGKLEEDQARG